MSGKKASSSQKNREMKQKENQPHISGEPATKEEVDTTFLSCMREFGHLQALQRRLHACIQDGHYNFSRARFKGCQFGSYLFENAQLSASCRVSHDKQTGDFSLSRLPANDNTKDKNTPSAQSPTLRQRTAHSQPPTDEAKQGQNKRASKSPAKEHQASSASSVQQDRHSNYSERHTEHTEQKEQIQTELVAKGKGKGKGKKRSGGNKAKAKQEGESKEGERDDREREETKEERGTETEEEGEGEEPVCVSDPAALFGVLAPAEVGKARRQFSQALELAVEIASSLRHFTALQNKFVQQRAHLTSA